MSVTAPEAASNSAPPELRSGCVLAIETPEEFDSLLELTRTSNTLLIADFQAAWCRKCKYLLPRLRRMAVEHSNVYFATIDVNKVARLPREYQIQKMPTFLLFSGGQEVDRLIGAAEAGAVVTELQATVDKFLSASS